MDDNTVNVRYMVDDVDAAVALYTTHFDFTVNSNAAPAFADVIRGRLRLLLSGPGSSAGRPMRDGRQPVPGGWNRIHLIVADLPAEVERLQPPAWSSATRSSPGPEDLRSSSTTLLKTPSNSSNPLTGRRTATALWCSVLADEPELVPVWVTDRELPRAVRSVEEARRPRPGPDPPHHASTSRTLKLYRPVAGTGSSSEIANCAEPVWKWAYFGASGGQWPCAGSPRICSYQATALSKSRTLTLTCSSRGTSMSRTLQPAPRPG